ncbi:MAG: hypothetical protein RLZ87_1513 [Armatimonadota bacterium]|jgi:hypothetical protein
MKRSAAILILLGSGTFAFGDASGRWQGVAMLSNQRLTVPAEGNELVKLQMSKAFIKGAQYLFELKPGGTFLSTVRIPDGKPRTGKGNWSVVGKTVILKFREENQQIISRQLKGTLGPDGKRMNFIIPGYRNLPDVTISLKKLP